MFRTAASIAALSFGLIASGSALAADDMPAANHAGMYKAMQGAELAATDVNEREKPVERGDAGVIPGDPTDSPSGPIEQKAHPAPDVPGEEDREAAEAAGDRDVSPGSSPTDSPKGPIEERAHPAPEDPDETAEATGSPGPGNNPTDDAGEPDQGGFIDETEHPAPMVPGKNEDAENPVTKHLPNEDM